jgi:hypothetical protein
MRDLQPLAVTRKNDRVIPHNVTRPNGAKADRFSTALAGAALAPIDSHLR